MGRARKGPARYRFVPDALFSQASDAMWALLHREPVASPPEALELARRMLRGARIFPRSAMPEVLRCRSYDDAVSAAPRHARHALLPHARDWELRTATRRGSGRPLAAPPEPWDAPL